MAGIIVDWRQAATDPVGLDYGFLAD